MIMRLQFRILISSVMMLLLVCLSSVDERQVSAQQVGEPKGVVVFCVSSAGPAESSMEPILLIDDGKYTNPVAGDSDASALSEFASKFYNSGQKYRLLFGGGDAGSLTVKKSAMDSECFRAGASIKLSALATVKLNRNVMALATNLESLGHAQISRRVPTPAERAEGIRLAKQAYKEKGASTALLSTIEVVNLTAMDLDADGNAELIGTFVLKKTKRGAERHVVFLIAEMQGQGYRTALYNYERFTTKDIMSGGSLNSIGAEGIYTERLVDQLDMDADGTGEVISITNGFEGVTYKMYKKQAGKWKSVYEFGSYRCAF
jgi:hypothetical protein